MFDKKYGYVTSPLGQLHYAEQGEGPILLLLHQTPRSLDEFRELMPMLADSFRVIAMDMYGFGASAKFSAPQTIEMYAEGGFALLDALGIGKARVLGHHTGSLVALEMGAASPERLDAMVLSSMPLTNAEYREAHAEGEGVDIAPTADDGSHLTHLWALRRPFYPELRPDLLDRFIHDALSFGIDPAEGHSACSRYVMENRIGRVVAPVLLIGASEDPFSFPHLKRVARELVNSTRVQTLIIEGGTIPMMEQKAEEIAAGVKSFLGGLK
jgi:pimeloyl-ACP methyl ester carboxylesterase